MTKRVRDPGNCPWCGEGLERHGDDPGDRPYWACPSDDHPPVAVLPPVNLHWALAHVRSGLGFTSLGSTELDELDPDAPDPGRFVDRLCERLATVQATVREQDRERRLEERQAEFEDLGRDVDAETQSDLTGWSA